MEDKMYLKNGRHMGKFRITDTDSDKNRIFLTVSIQSLREVRLPALCYKAYTYSAIFRSIKRLQYRTCQLYGCPIFTLAGKQCKICKEEMN